jgi:hypothetical protein
MYGTDALGRLAFSKIGQRLDRPLDIAAVVLDASRAQWRLTVRQQTARLAEVIAQDPAAHQFLSHALNRPPDRPARECEVVPYDPIGAH